MERDPHEGAKQRLAAFTFAAGLARRRVALTLDARRERSGRGQQARDELRQLARAPFPSVCGRAGLAAAVESPRDRQPAVRPAGLSERFPPAVEDTAFGKGGRSTS